MLRITTSKSVKAAETYFKGALSQGDYYLDGQEVAGNWGGRGAEMLGLSGAVKKEDFISLVRNLRPDGSKLTPRNAPNRRPGYDFTFDVPKSVSVMQAMMEDDQITQALHRSINQTMQDIENQMHTRVRKDGAFDDRHTGNMVWADFTHYTTRPAVEANGLAKGVPDPQLHVHVFAMNATYDKVEDTWKAGEFSRIKKDAPLYQAMFHTRFAGELQKLGYNIVPTKDAFEIDGVDEQTIRRFARRTSEIDQAAELLGITDADQKGELGAKIRRRKNKDFTLSFLRKIWKEALSIKEADQIQATAFSAALKEDREPIDDPEAAKHGINYALEHELERVSETSESRLLATALARSVGRAGIQSVKEAYQNKNGLIRAEIDGETRLSTKAVLAEEKALLELTRGGGKAIVPMSWNEYQFRTDLFRDLTKDTREQKEAVKLVMEGSDWVCGVVGRAGTGKTTLLHEIAAGVKGARSDLVLCAPTAEASRGVLRDEGFENAETVKKILSSPRLQERLRDNVLWIDEAGMIGNRDLLSLMSIAREKGARKVVLAGDYKQIRSVPRGDAFRMLEENGLKVARLDNILRQRNPRLKEAVEAISQGDAVKGFKILDREKAIREISDRDERHKALAKAFVKGAIGRKPTKGLVISPTHKEGEQVTRAIRDELKERGHLQGEEHMYVRNVPMGWTEAEKANPANYNEGQIVQFRLRAPGIMIGEQLRVASVDRAEGRVMGQRANGELTPLPISYTDRFAVYRQQALKLMKNDVIRITKNADIPGHGTLVNGSMQKVEGFTRDGDIQLRNGKVLPRDFAHMTHGCCVTADASQAKTVDRVYVAMGAESFGASDMARAYVSISRAKFEAHVFTDDRRGLLDAVSRDHPRRTAGDIDALERKQREERNLTHQLSFDEMLSRHIEGYERLRETERLRDQERARTYDVSEERILER